MTRVVVHERRLVAVLLAGGASEVLAGELVDDELRAVAQAVLALRTVRQPPTDEAVEAAVRALGAKVEREGLVEVLEGLRREGAMRRAA